MIIGFVMLNFIPSKVALLCPQETVWQGASFCFERRRRSVHATGT